MTDYEAFRVTDWIEPVEEDSLRVEVTKPLDAEQARLVALLERATVMPDETYTRLLINNRLWMTDTRDEFFDHLGFIHRAHGRVLIHGLGLGCSLKAILEKPNVEHVDVVELNEQVLQTIGPYFERDERVNLIHDDALTKIWPKGATWDVVWHDIWADKCADQLGTSRARLNRRFSRRCAWQGAWAQDQLLSRRRQEQEAWWH